MLRNKKQRQNLSGYTFILPSLILLTVFVIAPIGISFFLSLNKYNGLKDPTWVGFKYYVDMFQDRDVRDAVWNTIVFVLITVPGQVVISLGLAAILAAKFKNNFGAVIRGALFIPELCSAAVVGIIFSYLFSADGEAFFNSILLAIGLPKQNWLGNPDLALPVVSIVIIWKNIGYYLVIFYAGIMDVPINLYEAAELDGASAWKQFWHITIPGLRNVLIMVITICIIWSFQMFDITYTMTQGGPGNATTSLVLEIYKAAFKKHNFGYASAMAILLFVIIAVITIIQRYATREKD